MPFDRVVAEWGRPHMLHTRLSQTGVYYPRGIIIMHSWTSDGPLTRNIRRKLIAYIDYMKAVRGTTESLEAYVKLLLLLLL